MGHDGMPAWAALEISDHAVRQLPWARCRSEMRRHPVDTARLEAIAHCPATFDMNGRTRLAGRDRSMEELDVCVLIGENFVCNVVYDDGGVEVCNRGFGTVLLAHKSFPTLVVHGVSSASRVP